jgi:hypothetical protein
MTLERTIRIASLAIPIFFCAGPETTRAEKPEGDYEIILGGSNPIITIGDISFVEQQCDFVPNFGGELCIEVSANLQPTVDTKGKISGVGSFAFDASGAGIEITGTMGCMISGRVNGRMDSASRDHDTKIAIKLRCDGNADVTGLGVSPARVTAKIKGEADDDGIYLGEVTAKIRIRGFGCEKFVIPVDLQFGNGGDWTIALNIADVDGKKLSGTALATLDDGSAISFEVRGRYNERKDKSNVMLKPDPPFKGASIRLRHLVVTGDAIVSGELKYKVNGQKGKVIDP